MHFSVNEPALAVFKVNNILFCFSLFWFGLVDIFCLLLFCANVSLRMEETCLEHCNTGQKYIGGQNRPAANI